MQRGNVKKVVLGLSGGVDSAVAAHLLKEEGYEMHAVYLKNWTEKDEHGVCPAEQDRLDAMRVAAKLNIPFTTVDYETEYRDRVFAFLLKGLGEGLTPNPDILCNPLVKFEALLGVADSIGAHWIATGHYARRVQKEETGGAKRGPPDGADPAQTVRGSTGGGAARQDPSSVYYLAAGKDKEKDQSYFLSRITYEQLSRSLFPIGEYTKKEVRALAHTLDLHVADKESTSGICFIGERNFETFMKDRVPAHAGPVVTISGEQIAEHRGLPFYTVGQRHGFGGGGGFPYYVAEKNTATNTLVVAPAYDPALFHREIVAGDAHWITETPLFPLTCKARIRYRQPLQDCTVTTTSDQQLAITFIEGQRAVTPGQYIAFYTDDFCLGSAMIG